MSSNTLSKNQCICVYVSTNCHKCAECATTKILKKKIKKSTQGKHWKLPPDIKILGTSTSYAYIFMPPDRMIGGILFLSCLFVCLFVCLSVVNFNLRYNLWTVRDGDLIFGVHTPIMMPFQMTPSSMTLSLTLMLKIAFWTLLPPGAYCSVSQTHLDFFCQIMSLNSKLEVLFCRYDSISVNFIHLFTCEKIKVCL